jgi:L-malate glycosyltransferase
MADQPLRILGIGPGRSINFLRWARILSARGHDVHIVSDVLTDQPEELDGVHAHNVRSLGPLMRVKGLRNVGFGRAIAKLGRELDVDVVHAHYLLPYGFWGAQAGLHPYVVSPWSRDLFFGPEVPARGPKRAKASIAAADYLVTNSRANEEASVELGADPNRMREVIWYAETERFGADKADPQFRARLGWPEDALVVLSLRNFRPYTNVDVIVRAFAKIAPEEPKARLFLAARTGTEHAQIEALLDELGIRSLTHFQRLLWEDLPSTIASCDLAVTIADTDSTPASLLETMASALPVVAGPAPSIDEWVEQDEGAEMVADRRDVDAVAAAILKLLRDPELRSRYGERNDRVVRERLSEPPALALERLYRELVSTG